MEIGRNALAKLLLFPRDCGKFDSEAKRFPSYSIVMRCVSCALMLAQMRLFKRPLSIRLE